MSYIIVPLHIYDNEHLLEDTNYIIGSNNQAEVSYGRAGTLKVKLTDNCGNDFQFYGVYPSLPEVRDKIEEQLTNYSWASPSIFGNYFIDNELRCSSIFKKGEYWYGIFETSMPDGYIEDLANLTKLFLEGELTEEQIQAVNDRWENWEEVVAEAERLADTCLSGYVGNSRIVADTCDRAISTHIPYDSRVNLADTFVTHSEFEDWKKQFVSAETNTAEKMFHDSWDDISNKPDLKKGKENCMAMNLFGDIRVGKAGPQYSLTYFGTVAYRGKSYYQGKIFDATGMTINFDMLYFVPSTEVKKGDIIEHNGVGHYVTEVANGVIKAVNLLEGNEDTIVPGGPFGMVMYSKLFNPFGNMDNGNSFGNMLLMQSLMGDDRGNGNNGMLLAMMMMQGGFKLPSFEFPVAKSVEPATKPVDTEKK